MGASCWLGRISRPPTPAPPPWEEKVRGKVVGIFSSPLVPSSIKLSGIQHLDLCWDFQVDLSSKEEPSPHSIGKKNFNFLSVWGQYL